MRQGPEAELARVEEAEQQLLLLAKVLPQASMYIFDAELRILRAGGPLFADHGLGPVQSLEGRLVSDVLPANAWAQVEEHYAAVLRGEHRSFEYASIDGVAMYLMHFAPLRDDAGSAAGGAAFVRDITEQRDPQLRIHRRLCQQTTLSEITAVALRGEDVAEMLQSAADLIAQTLKAELVGAFTVAGDELSLVAGTGAFARYAGSPRLPYRDYDELTRALGSELPIVVEDSPAFRDVCDRAVPPRFLLARIAAADFPLGLFAVARAERQPLREDEVTFAASVCDVIGVGIARRRREDELRHATQHDSLTGLANRTSLLGHLKLALARNQRYHTQLAVSVIDLDGFKEVNDEFGHAVGDGLLRQVAERLRVGLRDADLVARLGGDEFVLLCEMIAGPAQVEGLIERLRAAFAEPFVLPGGESREISASVGVLIAGDRGGAAEDVLEQADAQMYEAKRAGDTGYSIGYVS